ncbi:hypothetical protein ABPG75_002169 [Micractinium tetrahymenae]
MANVQALCRVPQRIVPRIPAAKRMAAARQLKVASAAVAETPASAARPASTSTATTLAPTERSQVVPFRPHRPAAQPSTSLLRLVTGLEPSAYISGLPAPSGRKQEPCWVATRPAASAAGSCDSWFSSPTYIDLNANVSPAFAGLSPPEVEAAAAAFFGATQQAVDAATAAIAADPACTAAQLRGLLSFHSHALALVGPGGASALAMVDDRLLRLLDRAASAVTTLLAGGPDSMEDAQDAAVAILRLVSALSFGRPAAAAPFAPAIAAAVGVIRAAADAGALFDELDFVELIEAAAHSDPCLHRNMWYGHNFAAALWLRLLAGWSSGELAQRYLTAWGALVGRGALQYSACKHRRLVRCVMRHVDGLSVQQLDRLLAAEHALPVEHTCSDRAWLARWQAQVERRRGELAAAAQQQKAARRTSRRAGRAADAVAMLAADAAALAAAEQR